MAGTFLRVVAVLALVGLLAGGAIAIYNAGVTAGLAADGALPAYPWFGYGYGYGHGFGFGGFFGFLFFLFGVFLIIGLIRAAFGRGRGWHGHGDGPGWKGPMGERGEAVRDWHRRLHEEEAAAPPER